MPHDIVFLNGNVDMLVPFQDNLKKRLRYAMPRVSLQKLKGETAQIDDSNNPTCHVGAIAMRINDKKRGVNMGEMPKGDKSQSGNVSLMKEQNKVSEAVDSLSTAINKTMTTSFVESSDKDESIQTVSDSGHFQNVSKLQKVQNVASIGLTGKEINELDMIESRLRNVHQGKRFKFVLVKSDSDSEDRTENQSCVSVFDNEYMNSSTDVEDDMTNVGMADIENASVKGAVGGLIADHCQFLNENSLELVKLCTLHCSENAGGDEKSSNLSKESGPPESRGRRKNRLNRKRAAKTGEHNAQVQWGQDETSESENDVQGDDREGRMSLL